MVSTALLRQGHSDLGWQVLHTSCLGMAAQLSCNGGSHERAPAAVEALVLALHVVVTEAAHTRIHSIAATAAALHA